MLNLPGKISGKTKIHPPTSFNIQNYIDTELHCLKTEKRPHPVIEQAQQVEPQDSDVSDQKDFLHCTRCHYPITRKADRATINDKHEHVFVNPHGYIYEIGCFAQAPGCVIVGEASSHFSWFPGYTWQVSLCGQCLTLLGWAFRTHGSQFFGLILNKLAETSPSES